MYKFNHVGPLDTQKLVEFVLVICGINPYIQLICSPVIDAAKYPIFAHVEVSVRDHSTRQDALWLVQIHCSVSCTASGSGPVFKPKEAVARGGSMYELC